MNQNSIGAKILHFPLTRLIVGVLVCGGVAVLAQQGGQVLLSTWPLPPEIQAVGVGLLMATLTLLAYRYLFAFYEQRLITELDPTQFVSSAVVGLLLGFLLQSLVILVIYLAGGYAIVTWNPLVAVLPAFVLALTAAVVEEIIIRGILFRILEEKLGSIMTLALTALLFGLLHLGNPGSSTGTAIGLALQAGVLLGAAFLYRRNLWLPIFLHFAWNFTEAGIYGAIISGTTVSQHLLTSRFSGPRWLTGGGFGPEGSVQATFFCVVAGAALLRLAAKRGNLQQPFWVLRSRTTA